MLSPKAARAATAPAVSSPQVEQIGDQLDRSAIANLLSRQVQYLVARHGLEPRRAQIIASLAWEAQP